MVGITPRELSLTAAAMREVRILKRAVGDWCKSPPVTAMPKGLGMSSKVSVRPFLANFRLKEFRICCCWLFFGDGKWNRFGLEENWRERRDLVGLTHLVGLVRSGLRDGLPLRLGDFITSDSIRSLTVSWNRYSASFQV